MVVVDAEPLENAVSGSGVLLLSDALHVDEARLDELLQGTQNGGAPFPGMGAVQIFIVVVAILYSNN